MVRGTLDRSTLMVIAILLMVIGHPDVFVVISVADGDQGTNC